MINILKALAVEAGIIAFLVLLFWLMIMAIKRQDEKNKHA